MPAVQGDVDPDLAKPTRRTAPFPSWPGCASAMGGSDEQFGNPTLRLISSRINWVGRSFGTGRRSNAAKQRLDRRPRGRRNAWWGLHL